MRLTVKRGAQNESKERGQQLSLGQYTGVKAKWGQVIADCNSDEGGERGVLIFWW